MKNFSIHVVDRSILHDDTIPYCFGEIQVGDYEEKFPMPLDFWNIEDYEQQWKEGIERLKTHNSSCLVSKIQRLTESETWAVLWMLYKEGDTVYMQERIIFPTKIANVFKDRLLTPQTCYSLISKRAKRKNDIDEGQQPAEWEIGLQDILRFAEGSLS